MFEDIAKQLDPIFKPESVALIGATENPTSWSMGVMRRLVTTGYSGAVYPVNPHHEKIMGLKAYASVSQIPGQVDLAVIVIPAASVPGVIEDCVRKKVKGAVIITAGFAEAGDAGKALQDEMVGIARRGGVRIVGPNVNGIYSSVGQLNIPFDRLPQPGPIAFISHSGMFGGHLLRIAANKGYEISKFIPLGNQADLNAADYLAYLAQDGDTRVIVLYIEGFVQGRRFFNVAREAVKVKPIIIFKGGYTSTGARAALSHTASLSGSEEIFDALCRQAGLIRAREAIYAFDMAHALAYQPLPPGNRVAIIGSGGQGVVTADACASLGLEVPQLDSEAALRLKRYLPSHGLLPQNPFDYLGGSMSAVDRAGLTELLIQLDYIDGIIANIPNNWLQGGSPTELGKVAIDAAKMLAAIPMKYDKPIIAVSPQQVEGKTASVDILKSAGIPIYLTPEECARAMYALVSYSKVRKIMD